jgi:stress-induced morphogen
VHFEAVVIAPAFAGKRAVQRHQLVYSTLGSAVGGEIHALALQVYTPDEYAGQARG